MKIAVYHNNTNTLGHSTRLLALLKNIKQSIPRSQAVLLDGGEAPMALPSARYAKVVTLPYALDWKGRLIHNNSSCTVEQMLQARIKIVRSVLKEFRPDIFIVEHFPFGQTLWALEMPFLLDYVRGKIGCKVVASVGYLNYAERLYENMDKYFDHIFVHSPRTLAMTYIKQLEKKAAQEMTRVLVEFKDKIVFTGFICDQLELRDICRESKGFKKMVFVSRGGGVCSDNIIISALLSARRKTEWLFVVCCGPATSQERMQEYRRLVQGARNVRLCHFLQPDEFDRYLTAADLCVSMSGYNTSLKLMFFRKRAVLVPHTTSEQRWRAKQLLDYIPAVQLTGKMATANRLCAAMDLVLKKVPPKKRILPEWFEGADQTARMLSCLV